MSILSSLKATLNNILPHLKNTLLLTSVKQEIKTLVLQWLENLLKKAVSISLNMGSVANTLPQQPVMAALQLVSLATQAEATEPLPDKLTVAAKLLYPQLPAAWQDPNGPLTESELLAVLRDGLRLSRSIQSVIQRS